MKALIALALLTQSPIDAPVFESAQVVYSSTAHDERAPVAKTPRRAARKLRSVMLTIPNCGGCVQSKPLWGGEVVDDRDERWAARYGVMAYPAFVVVDAETGELAGRVDWTGSAQTFVAQGYALAEQLAAREAPRSSITPEAQATPYAEVVRVISLLPRPEVGFVDFGCGDARWCVVAAERWGCRCTGVEIDSGRAEDARARVRAAGLDHLITIVTGDATSVDVQADVGVAYLYDDVLAKLAPRISKLRAFASYIHKPTGLPRAWSVTQSGDTWVCVRQDSRQASVRQVQYVQPRPTATWNGVPYSAPVCNNPRCAMCNAIRAQLAGR